MTANLSKLTPVLAVFLLAALHPVPPPEASAGEVAVIPVKYRRAAEMVPMVQGLLTEKGSVSADTRTNALIVVDTPQALQRVRAYLERFDQPVEQVRIRVRFDQQRGATRRSVEAEGNVSGRRWRVGTGSGPRDGVAVRLQDHGRQRDATSEFYIITASGSPAYIRAGSEIPYRERWIVLTRRHAAVADTVTFKSIDTGFEVTPVVTGSRVLLRILPRIAEHDSETGIIHFHGAQTELTVPLGQWVTIGGSDSSGNEVMREILSRGRAGASSATVMSLLVEKY